MILIINTSLVCVSLNNAKLNLWHDRKIKSHKSSVELQHLEQMLDANLILMFLIPT